MFEKMNLINNYYLNLLIKSVYYKNNPKKLSTEKKRIIFGNIGHIEIFTILEIILCYK